MVQIKSSYRAADPMIVLVGPMGAGKTTVGRALSRHLNLGFVDLDSEIEKDAKMTITEIFGTEGEAGFRQRETEMLDRHCCTNGTVISTGGGVILSEKNRVMMRNGFVVYLHATPNQQYERIRHRSHRRPKIDSKQPLAGLADLMQVRDPLYRSEADIIVRTDGRPINVIVKEIEYGLLHQ
ncbi:MAG: shikimate kinase [Acidiferrobacterales bacterium]|nr:shikimate kinase [Acidiferrobacterales bacterium]